MTAPPPGAARRTRMADTLARVAADFRRELPARLAQAQALSSACRDAPGDDDALQALHRLLHSLAGTAGTLGLDAVGQAARAGELAAQALRQLADRSAQDFGPLQRCVDDLAARVRAACAPPD